MRSHHSRFDMYKSDYSWRPYLYKLPIKEDDYLVFRVFLDGTSKQDVAHWKDGKFYINGVATYNVTHWKILGEKPDDEYAVYKYNEAASKNLRNNG